MEPGFDEKQQTEQLEGYKDETDLLKNPTREFLRQYYEQLYSGEPERNYDFSELIIEADTATRRKIKEGKAKIKEVKIYYEKGEPFDIRVDFAREGEGAPGFLYLRGQALKDFLGGGEIETQE